MVKFDNIGLTGFNI